MPLTPGQIHALRNVHSNFPHHYATSWGAWRNEREAAAHSVGSIQQVEQLVLTQLHAGNQASVLDGLCNVLYWGLGGPKMESLRKARVTQLRAAVARIPANLFVNRISDLKPLKLPHFGAMAFGSKLRTFLEPTQAGVFDSKILSAWRLQLRSTR
jgi:hypothetical protein